MTVLLGVSMGARTVRMAQPRTERAGADLTLADGVPGTPRPLFFRNEAIDTADEAVEYLAAESIDVATQSDPATATGVAYRDARQADALHQAMEKRHVQNYHLVSEVDAVIEYLLATGEAAGCENVALFDLGSSGLTVSVVDLLGRRVITSRRTTEFSGDRLDELLRDNQLDRLGKPATSPDMDLFETRCRVAKERLSSNDAVCLPDESGMILLSRDSFEILIGDVLDEAIEWARSVLIDAHAPIDAVVLLGGCARIPLVHSRVGPVLELPTISPTEPETVSARGAALSARPMSAGVSVGATALRPVPAGARATATRPVASGPALGASEAALGSWVTQGVDAEPETADEAAPVVQPRPIPALSDRSVAVEEAPARSVASAAQETVRMPEPAPQVAPVEEVSAKSVPFQLKNVYWLDADYDDDDGEDDATIRRRRMRTGGILGVAAAAVVGVSAFFLTQGGSDDVAPASVTQSEVPVATSAPQPTTSQAPAVVLPPPAPVTTVEPTPEAVVVEPEPEVVQQVPEVTTEPEAVTTEPAPAPAPAPEPPPLIPGLPDFTLPTIPPLFPPAP